MAKKATKKAAKPVSLGLSVMAEIKSDKAKKKSRKGKGGGDAPSDGRADADMVKRIVDNSFCFKARDGGGLVVDVTTTYPMRGRKPKCRCGFEELPALAAAILEVHAKHEAALNQSADDFAEQMKAEGK